MPFLSLAGIRHTFDRQDWTVIESPSYHSTQLDRTLTAPIGLHTDLASVPRLVWLLIPPMDKHVVDGAVIHDWLYQSCGNVPGGALTRKQCDQFLRDACIAEKAPNWYKTIIYLGVRAGGWIAWRKYAKRTP